MQQQQTSSSTPTQQQTVQSQPVQQIQQQPQVITLQQLQNFFPQQAGSQAQQIHQLNAADAAQLQQQVQAMQAAQSPQQNSQNSQQAQQLKTLYASPTQQQQVINLPQQFIQMKNDQPQQQIIQIKQPDGTIAHQIIQLKPEQVPQQQQQMQQVIQGGQLIQGPNGMFQLVQPMQTVTVDGQEALFIPNQMSNAQAVQIGGQQAFITPSGQIVRAPMMAPGNFLHNMPQTVQLPNGKLHIFFLTSHVVDALILMFTTCPIFFWVSGLESLINLSFIFKLTKHSFTRKKFTNKSWWWWTSDINDTWNQHSNSTRTNATISAADSTNN